MAILSRSKSEVIIASEPLSVDIDFEYEALFEGKSGSARTTASLGNAKSWPRDQENLPLEEDGGESRILTLTMGDEEVGINSKEISDLIRQTLA